MTENCKKARNVCVTATSTSTWYPHILYSLIYQPHSMSLHKNPPQKSLEMTARPFLTSSQGYKHSQGHPGSKCMEPPDTAVAAAAAAPLHFHSILKEQGSEPQHSRGRAIKIPCPSPHFFPAIVNLLSNTLSDTIWDTCLAHMASGYK